MFSGAVSEVRGCWRSPRSTDSLDPLYLSRPEPHGRGPRQDAILSHSSVPRTGWCCRWFMLWPTILAPGPFLHRLLEDPPVLLIPHPDPVYRLGGDGHPGGWMSRLRRADSSNLVNIIFIYGSDMLVTWYLL